MFYELPPFLNLLILLAPTVFFRVQDYKNYRKAPEYKELRERYRSYWVYSTVAPRNPRPGLLAIQIVWAAIMLIPFR